MNPIRHLRRLAAALAALASALLAFAAAAPAAFASGQPPPLPPIREKHPFPPPGHFVGPVYKVPVPVPVHTVVIGGMPGWQITLIAIGAALLAATAAVVVYRAWTTRRKPVTATA
jgi:hypothetical protein